MDATGVRSRGRARIRVGVALASFLLAGCAKAGISPQGQDVHQLFVITHAEQVKDQFPVSILVNKTGRRRSSATVV